jgi:Ribosomal protein S12/S23
LAQGARLRSTRLKKSPHSRTPRLYACPFGRGLVAKIKLYSKPRVTARIPGSGFGVVKFNRVLVRGGRANDLPGVSYSLVRGVYDFSPHFGKKRCRSFYGVPRPEGGKHVRRRVRLKAVR